MKNILYAIYTTLVFIFVVSCSDTEQFRVNGTIKGEPTMNLRAVYYADGAYRSVITAVRGGEFEFYASSKQPTLLEITDYDYKPLGRLYVSNGNAYEINIDPTDQYAVEAGGSDINPRWADFLRQNADSLRTDAGKAVADYVRTHPDDIVSTLLLLTTFDSSGAVVDADSLMSLIKPEARPSSLTEGYNYMLQRLVTSEALGDMDTIRYIDRGGNLMVFDASKQRCSLLSISVQSDKRTDSIVPALKRMNKKYDKSEFAMLDFSLDSDTTLWKSSIRVDSADWKQGWAPGGLAAIGIGKLGVPSVPFFIVCDSTGNQLYRGPHIKTAEKTIKNILKK